MLFVFSEVVLDLVIRNFDRIKNLHRESANQDLGVSLNHLAFVRNFKAVLIATQKFDFIDLVNPHKFVFFSVQMNLFPSMQLFHDFIVANVL